MAPPENAFRQRGFEPVAVTYRKHAIQASPQDFHGLAPSKRSVRYLIKKLGSALAVVVGCMLAGCNSDAPVGPQQTNGGSASTAGTTPAGGNPNGGAVGGAGGSTGGSTAGGVANGAAGQAVTAGAAPGGSGGGSSTGGATTGGAAGGGGSNSAGASGMGGSGAGGNPFPEGVVKPRIMIVGDSISAGPGCYKKFLLKDLKDNGYSSFEFVGEYPDDCNGGVMHSAVSCSTAEQYTQASFTVPNCTNKTYQGLAPLATKHKPDLLMMQLGVNDAWGNRSVATILGNYAKLVTQARAQNPKIVIVVAQIQKIKPDCSNEAVYGLVESLVKAVPDWAAQQSQPTSPVFVADLWTNSDPSKAETLDCVHPNDAGAQRMGRNWYNALKGILKKG
jgi:lysophospholipase L1-like esterase